MLILQFLMMTAAAVTAAGVFLAVLVMAALYTGIVLERTGSKCLYSGIGISGYTAKKFDIGGSKRSLCAAADTTADITAAALLILA